MRLNLVILSMIFSTVLISSCQEQPKEAAAPQAKLVKVITLVDEGYGQYRDFPAIVEASEDAILAFRVAGQLNKLLVLPGAEVKEGDVLASLDPTDYQLALDSAQANFDLASSQFKRSEQLLSQQLVSRAGFDEVKSQLQLTQAALKVAQQNLAYTKLIAPFDGQVAQRFVQNFENITAQQPIVTLQKMQTLDIAIQLPEDFLSHIDKSTRYQPEVHFEANKSAIFRAKLKEYDTEANAATKSFKVVFSMPRPEEFNVLPGMSATVKVELDKVMKSKIDGWKIPASAFFGQNQDKQELSYVWRVNEQDKLEKVQVTVSGITESGFTVTSGLRFGDRIVAAGVQMLNEGDTVRVWQKERGL
ncbi:MAG: efflux RND transporter periplasmic adaptor subunit [Paraglaciecola sp.]|uniref:efflux RND transporter periplasmic adaptor subunit n=1 Tax=Pseudomonadati TaxID=3379134 RepID=UPI00273D11BC|nr:efflux RND transporter periplasmic adaptor subunit [Paraglaciecola sp.]MDP5032302.1 efflux RND transporter periplasmic adaptor subunit [Paraglaciecola sp.]MDP5130019.1 efflux RND transporter periplasmic adaptor subunit [Paraglaciecola sp.]